MQQFTPASAEELADVLGRAAAKAQTIQIIGKHSKRLMGGPVLPAAMCLSTANLRRVLRYERDDLTVSVEAGMPFAELQAMLAQNRQMLALDPPFAGVATVGGVLATNGSGPMRRGYGTARDLVIGMTFATLEGKLVKTGGMVVKNVAGLDMGKLMIGNFGTLGVITSVNFRVHSLPSETRTFLLTYRDIDSVMDMRDTLLRGVLQPYSLDVLTPPAAVRVGLAGGDMDGYVLAARAGGSANVLKRYSHEFSGATELSGREENDFWARVQDFSVDFVKRQPNGIVMRVSTTLTEVRSLLKMASNACISRAGSGVSYLHVTNWQSTAPIWAIAKERGWSVAVEFAPDEIRATKDLWQQTPNGEVDCAFVMMEKVKQMFDPRQLLNRLRLYGRI